METETSGAPQSRRPRTWLLVLLAVVVLAAVAMTLSRSADPELPASNSTRPPQQAAGEKLDSEALHVRLEALKQPLPVPDESDRNPFRFRPKPPPPMPPPVVSQKPTVPTGPPPPPPPPLVPPIPLKFIGITEAPGIGRVAALTDCRYTEQGREGETVYGRYRIVKIGTESVVIEYTDGKGRTTLPMNGQGCEKKEL